MSEFGPLGPPFDEPIIIDDPVGPGIFVTTAGNQMVDLVKEEDYDCIRKVDLHGRQWTIEDYAPLKFVAVCRWDSTDWKPELNKTEVTEGSAVVFTFSSGHQTRLGTMSFECGSDRTLTMDCIEQQGQSFRWKKIKNGVRAGLHPKANGAIYRVEQVDITTPGGNVTWRRGNSVDNISVTLSTR